MPPVRKLSPNSVWDQAAVLQAFEEHNIKPLHAAALWGHLIRHPEAHWSDVPNLPKAAVEMLDKYFTKFTTTVVDCKTSSDGNTTKLLVQLQDGMQVESVVMTYESSPRFAQDDHDADEQEAPCSTSDSISECMSNLNITRNPTRRRSTVCISSQVGCQMGCTFCATGTMGLKGHLTAGEIVEQLVHARAVADIKNIVFMGMGEPLANYEPVKAAVRLFTDSRLFGLKRRKVTISTVGVIPRIKQLSEDLPGVSLALSLHAPNQELRARIVPSARAYKLPALMDAVKQYQAASGQKIFVEYVMLAGVNDGLEQAHELGELLKGMHVIMNLIPWNPVYQPDGPFYNAPDDGNVTAFQTILRLEYGILCTVRQEKGQDISGACGQLVIEQSQIGKAGSSCGRKEVDIEDSAAAGGQRRAVAA